MNYRWNSATGMLYKDGIAEVVSEDSDPKYQEYLNWLLQGNEVEVFHEPPVSLGEGGIYASSESVSSSTSTKERSKVYLDTTLRSGWYKLEWSYVWAYTHTSSNFMAWIYVDDLPIHTHVQEPQDGSSKQMIPVSGFAYVQLEEGQHRLDLRWAPSLSGQTAYISQARILISKVGIS